MIDQYVWRGGKELMLRFGPAEGPLAIVTLPLFEEANRLRAFAVTVCRSLADGGVASVLPDVPGQGESLTDLRSCTLANMRSAIAAAGAAFGRSDRNLPYSVALRSGALLDQDLVKAGRWLFAPQSGANLVQVLERIKRTSDRLGPEAPGEQDPDTPLFEIAGNRIPASLLESLRTERADGDGDLPQRIVRLSHASQPADQMVEGSALWRRAEPGNDPALAALLASDIVAWIAACER